MYMYMYMLGQRHLAHHRHGLAIRRLRVTITSKKKKKNQLEHVLERFPTSCGDVANAQQRWYTNLLANAKHTLVTPSMLEQSIAAIAHDLAGLR